MGSGNWDSSKWKSYASTRGIDNSRTVDEVYNTSSVKEKYLPYNVTRESCDSVEHPNSTPIAIGLDVTGSMGRIVHMVAKKLDTLISSIYEKNPVTDPQLMFAAIDDYFATETPLQVTQFESDIRIAEQLTDLKFISHGGGNGFESYPLFWYFCAKHTKLDCENHGKKGFLFTMGDDGFPKSMGYMELKEVFGDCVDEGITTEQLVEDVFEKYELFHFCLTEGGSYRERDYIEFQKLLGSHAIKVENYEYLPEIITSILELYSGKTLSDITSYMEEDCANSVIKALSHLENSKDDIELF